MGAGVVKDVCVCVSLRESLRLREDVINRDGDVVVD